MFTLDIDDQRHLRILEARDAPEFFALARKNRDRLTVWCPWVGEVETLDKAASFIETKLERYAALNGFTAGIYDRRALIGVIAQEWIDWQNRSTEIGYWIDHDMEGKGVVTQACRVLIRQIFSEPAIDRIQIRVATENVRSRSIPERLGFSFEGTLRQCERLADRTVDLSVYGLLRSDRVSQDSAVS